MTPQTLLLAALLVGNLATGTLWLAQRTATEQARTELAQAQNQAAQGVAAAHRENARELSRLVQTNTEVQRALDLAQTDLDALALARDRSAGLRESERAAIVGAAERAAAGACGRYAEAAERHLEGAQDDATTMGERAVRASAAAHALRDTLTARREALKAKREALKPTRPE
jgi:hypothetical protein